jgi:hypothetical protein
VQHKGVAPRFLPLELAAEKAGVGVQERPIGAAVWGNRFGKQIEQLARLAHTLHRLLHVARVVEHHLAHGPHKVPSGIGVVAHIGHAIGRQMLAAKVKKLILNVSWHPGKHAMGDDIVKAAQLRPHLKDVLATQRHVVEAEGIDHSLALCDLTRRIVEPHKAGLA